MTALMSWTRTIVLAVGLAVSTAAVASTLDKNIDAVKAAIDPANGPPIAEPIFPDREFGGPGPTRQRMRWRLG